MGNRGGALHNERREIVRQYASRRWIACQLEFRGRHRSVMSPGRYTELFFLDEAVALAAGHRPCAECRRERFNAFRDAWGVRAAGADDIDRELHAARIDRRKGKVTYKAAPDSLPDGCMVQVEDGAFLVHGDALLLWSPEGYVERRRRPHGERVTVLTPEPMVRCLRAGYQPELHQSVKAFGG
jgi:hypothetical protein